MAQSRSLSTPNVDERVGGRNLESEGATTSICRVRFRKCLNEKTAVVIINNIYINFVYVIIQRIFNSKIVYY